MFFGQQALHALPGNQGDYWISAVGSHQRLVERVARFNLVALRRKHAEQRRAEHRIRLDQQYLRRSRLDCLHVQDVQTNAVTQSLHVQTCTIWQVTPMRIART